MKYLKELLKNMDPALLVIPLIFAVISVITIASTAYVDDLVFTRSMKVQIAAFAIGLIAAGVVLTIDYKTFEKMEKLLYIASLLFLFTVFIPGIGLEQYGAKGWLDLGPIDLQPAEIVKISFILMYASYLSRHQDRLRSLKDLSLAGAYLLPFLLVIVVLQNDLGNALVICVIALIMIFAAGVNASLYAKVAGAGVLCVPILYRFMSGHQKDRIDAFLHPDNFLLPGNYHVYQSKVAIGSGGLSGKGLFEGTQKQLEFLPVPESDFIFSVISEEWGFVGGLIVIALYALFLYRIMKIAQNAKDLYGSLVVIGVLSMFFFQIFENIGMTMGVMPVTGITLPFISAGGSSVVTNMIALGLVLNVCIRSKIINF